MKCPTCVAEGKKSRVYDEGQTVTLMSTSSYWDEDGKRHFHDPNTHTARYSCGNGHCWSESSEPKCPACGKEGF